METQIIGGGLQEVVFRTSDGQDYIAYGAVTATGEGESESIEVRGDDTLLGEFVTDQSEALTLDFAAMDLNVLQAITGNSYNSSPEGIEIPMGTDSEQNAPYVEVRAKSMARGKDGTTGFIVKKWFKCQVKNPSISQANGSEVAVTMEGRSYKTSENIEGNALSVACTSTWGFLTAS